MTETKKLIKKGSLIASVIENLSRAITKPNDPVHNKRTSSLDVKEMPLEINVSFPAGSMTSR